MRTEPTVESDEVCEPATACVIMGQLVELEGKEEDPAHTPTSEQKLKFYDLEEDAYLNLPFPMFPSTIKSRVHLLVPPSLMSPVSTEFLALLPKSASLLALPPFVPVSLSASPITPLCVDLPRICRSPALPRQVDLLAPPIVVDPISPPHSVDQSDPPSLSWLHQISCPYSSNRAPSSLQLRLGQTSNCLLHELTSAAPRLSTPLAPSGSAFPSAPPQSSDTLAKPRKIVAPAPPRLQDHQCCPVLSALHLSLGLHLHRPSLRQSSPWSVSSAKSSPWLLPPSTPLLDIVLAVLWVPASLLLLLPQSSPPWFFPSSPSPVSCPPPAPPLEPPPWTVTVQGRAFQEGGVMSRVACFFPSHSSEFISRNYEFTSTKSQNYELYTWNCRT